jgi:hypothetical protein
MEVSSVPECVYPDQGGDAGLTALRRTNDFMQSDHQAGEVAFVPATHSHDSVHCQEGGLLL